MNLPFTPDIQNFFNVVFNRVFFDLNFRILFGNLRVCLRDCLLLDLLLLVRGGLIFPFFGLGFGLGFGLDCEIGFDIGSALFSVFFSFFIQKLFEFIIRTRPFDKIFLFTTESIIYDFSHKLKLWSF